MWDDGAEKSVLTFGVTFQSLNKQWNAILHSNLGWPVISLNHQFTVVSLSAYNGFQIFCTWIKKMLVSIPLTNRHNYSGYINMLIYWYSIYALRSSAVHYILHLGTAIKVWDIEIFAAEFLKHNPSFFFYDHKEASNLVKRSSSKPTIAHTHDSGWLCEWVGWRQNS